MYLRDLTVRGFRAGARQDLVCTFPGRFSVLLGPNNVGKTTVCDALIDRPHSAPYAFAASRFQIASSSDAGRSVPPRCR